MKIKKYIVKVLSEVDSMIRRDLGPNAVILTVRQIKYKGIKSLFFSDQLEVVAAVDENDLVIHQDKKSSQETAKKNVETVFQAPKPTEAILSEQLQPDHVANLVYDKEFAREWESPMQTIEDFSGSLEEKSLPGLEEPAQYESSKIPGTYLDPRFNRKQMVEIVNEYAMPHPQESSHPASENLESPGKFRKADPLAKHHEADLENLRRASKLLIEGFAFSIDFPKAKLQSYQEVERLALDDEKLENLLSSKSEATSFFSLTQWLLSKGLASSLATAVTNNLYERYGYNFMSRDIGDGEFVESLSREIAGKIPVAGPLLITKGIPTCMVIVGPPGIGKTAALMKIAFQYVAEAGKKVAIIGIGTDRLENHAKLQMDCNKFALPLAFAQNKQELEEKIHSFQSHDLILLDMPGFSKADKQFMEEWTGHLQGIKNLQVQLALNAGIKDLDTEEWVAFFHAMQPKALIITMTDETSSLGFIPTICKLSGLPISYLSTGSAVPSDLLIADPNMIAKAIIT